MTTALEGGEWSASRPGRNSPPGKSRYHLFRRLGGPQDRSGQVRKISPPTGIRSPDRPARSSVTIATELPGPYNPFSPSGFFTFSSLITKNVLHYSHKVHFSVLQGSQNKQRWSLYSVNWLVFISDTGRVYCAVGIELSTMTANFRLQSNAMAQKVSRLPLTSDVWVRSQGTVTGFSPRSSVFPSPCSIFIFIYKLLFLERQVEDAWNQPDSKALSEIWKNWIENNFQIFLSLNA
jgi:hypothetical protein